LDEEERVLGTDTLRLALRAGRMAAWEWNGERDIWSEEVYELLGLPTDAVASTELFFSRVHPDDLPGLRRDWQRALDGTSPYTSEFRVVRDDGTTRWIRAVGEFVKDEAGVVRKVHGLNWDITRDRALAREREELLDELQRANAAKTRFLAMMSHELRSPLTAVLGFTRLLRAREDEPGKLDHLLRIERNGKFLVELIDDILDITRIEEGQLELGIEQVGVSSLLHEVIGMSADAAEAKGLTLRADIDDGVPKRILTDALRLRQVLHNLVGNAVKFTEVGSVHVRASADGDRLRFDVVDTGIGIPRSILPSLFEPFRQADNSVRRRVGGSGLGLAIARQLARLLGGDLTARSEPGHGSTFTLELPLGRADSTLDVPVRRPPDPTPFPGKVALAWPMPVRLLVVDDLQDNREFVAELLEASGFDVVTADGTAGALAALRRDRPPHAVLLDLHMPDRDGFEAARELVAAGYRGPLLALTADVLQTTADRARAEGFDEVVHKPVRPTELVDALTRQLARLVRILVVDDNEDVAHMLQLSLDLEGYVTATAGTASDGLRIARSFRPHVVLTDVRLPDLDGVRFARQVRRIPGLEGVPLFAVSGVANERAAMAEAFDACFVKPVELAELLAALAASLPDAPGAA